MRLLRYYKLYDWMIAELGLNSDSGIVAIVYSFSEVGKPCTLSYSQFADLLKVTRCNAIIRLQKLVRAGYLDCTCTRGRNSYTLNISRFASIENNTSASIENNTSASIENNTSASIENNTSASIENNTSASIENNTSLVSKSIPDTINREITESLTERGTEFLAPSLADVQHYFAEIGCRADAVRFFDYYTARGWQGVKDWRALGRVWCSRSSGSVQGKSRNSSIDVAALQAQLDANGVI